MPKNCFEYFEGFQSPLVVAGRPVRPERDVARPQNYRLTRTHTGQSHQFDHRPDLWPHVGQGGIDVGVVHRSHRWSLGRLAMALFEFPHLSQLVVLLALHHLRLDAPAEHFQDRPQNAVDALPSEELALVCAAAVQLAVE